MSGFEGRMDVPMAEGDRYVSPPVLQQLRQRKDHLEDELGRVNKLIESLEGLPELNDILDGLRAVGI